MEPYLKIQYVDPKTLEAAIYNARKWSEQALKGLRASISEFGICDPFIVNKRNGMRLVGGHMRCKVAIDLGIEQVPIVFVDLDDKKEKALNVALNNHRIAGDWILDDLDCLLDEIQTDDPVLYDDLNFGSLLEDVANAEISPLEDEPPPQEPTVDDDWVTFQLGEVKGKIFKDVALLVLSELERLQGVTGSDKLTPSMEVMAANSAQTPIESLT